MEVVTSKKCYFSIILRTVINIIHLNVVKEVAVIFI